MTIPGSSNKKSDFTARSSTCTVLCLEEGFQFWSPISIWIFTILLTIKTREMPHLFSGFASPFPLFQDVCSQCLLALSNLCKLSRPRQVTSTARNGARLWDHFGGKPHEGTQKWPGLGCFDVFKPKNNWCLPPSSMFLSVLMGFKHLQNIGWSCLVASRPWNHHEPPNIFVDDVLNKVVARLVAWLTCLNVHPS